MNQYLTKMVYGTDNPSDTLQIGLRIRLVKSLDGLLFCTFRVLSEILVMSVTSTSVKTFCKLGNVTYLFLLNQLLNKIDQNVSHILILSSYHLICTKPKTFSQKSHFVS